MSPPERIAPYYFVMPSERPVLSIYVWTEHFLGTPEKATSFLQLLRTLDGGRWTPERWSQFNPRSNVFEPKNDALLVAKWTEVRQGEVCNQISFKRRKPELSLTVVAQKTYEPDLNRLWCHVDAADFQGEGGPDRLKAIVCNFVSWSGAAYATACHSYQRHFRSAHGSPLHRLEQLNWLNFFGKPYLEMFGKERIRSCGFHTAEPFVHGFLLTAAERPDSPSMLRSNETLLRLEEGLGEEAFASDTLPELPCRMPLFDLCETQMPSNVPE